MNEKRLTKIVLIALSTLLLLSGCINNSQDSRLNPIYNRFEQLQKQLENNDKKYLKKLSLYCPQEGVIKISNAEKLFKTLQDWKKDRENIFIYYPELNFTNENTSFKDFKNENTVKKLINLNKQLMEFSRFIDIEPILKGECQNSYSQDAYGYTKPDSSLTCVINCAELTSIIEQIEGLSERDKLIIESSRKNND